MKPLTFVHSLFLFAILCGAAACAPPLEPAAGSAVIETTRPSKEPTAHPLPTFTPWVTPTEAIPFFTPTAVPFITPTPDQSFPSPTPVTDAAPPNTGYSNGATISDDGRYVGFISTALLADNVSGQNLAAFVHDTEMDTTQLINLNREGQTTAHDVYAVAMSGNGRFFAYFSFDGNIVADDTVMCGEGEYAVSCEDLFIYDRETGTTEMVALGRGEGLGADYTLSLTPDGRYIALGHERNLLFYDRETKETQFLLTTIGGTEPTSAVYVPAMSANGRYITFVSYANNLVADDTNEDADVFVLDRQTDQIERVSVASNGTQGNGTSGAMLGHESITISADMSADGRFVTFATTADNLGGEPFQDCVNYLSEPRPCYNVYVHDRDTGDTHLISQDLDSDSLSAIISGDGRYIAFNSRTTTLGAVMSPLCTPACNNIYLYDQTTGETLLIGEAPNGDSWVRDISADGRYIAFVSYASNLVPNDNNGDMDVFRYDRETNQIEAISIPGG